MSASVVGKTEISTSVEVKATIMVQIDLDASTHTIPPAAMARNLVQNALEPARGELSDWGGRWAIITDVQI